MLRSPLLWPKGLGEPWVPRSARIGGGRMHPPSWRCRTPLLQGKGRGAAALSPILGGEGGRAGPGCWQRMPGVPWHTHGCTSHPALVCSASRMLPARVARSSLGSSGSPGSPFSYHTQKACTLPRSKGETEAPGCAGLMQGHVGELPEGHHRAAREGREWHQGCLHPAPPTRRPAAPSIPGCCCITQTAGAVCISPGCCWGVSSPRSLSLPPPLPHPHSPGPRCGMAPGCSAHRSITHISLHFEW